MRKFFPIYPVLLGIIWVLVTYSNNAAKLPSPSVMVVPLLVVVGIIATIWVVSWLILRDWRKSALVVAIIFCLSIFHGYIRDYTHVEGIASAPIWLAFMVVGILVALKLTRSEGRMHLTVVANVVCIAVLCVSTYSVLASSSSVRVTDSPVSRAVPINSMPEVLPDIYYIIPDTYTSQLVLQTHLGYDNRDFYDYLEARGFCTNWRSNANYHHSILSISSVLNMRYWTDEELGEGDAEFLGEKLAYNPVVDTIKEAGYTYVHLGSWWGFTSTGAKADISLEFSGFNELSFTLYRTTIWCDLADFLFDKGGNATLRAAHLNQFDNLAAVSEMEEPTFTFCHLILPHCPFLFDADGNSTAGWLLTPEEWRVMYVNQLRFTTTKLEEVIDQILANSEVTPVIILCSDEGYSDSDWINYQESKGSLKSLMVDRPDLATMRQGNLFAVLYPNGDLSELDSPVNTFRVIFNDLFSSDLEMLPDRYYLKGMGNHQEELIDVTSHFEVEDGED